MNKLSLLFLAVCVGTVGFALLHRAAGQTRAATVMMQSRLVDLTNRLAEVEEKAATLRTEVSDKKARLREALNHAEINPDLLQLVERNFSGGSPAAWTELRRQLGIGWDCSPDYVLVSKQVLKDMDYRRLEPSERPSDKACGLLSLSAAEQSGLRSVVQRAREAWQTPAVARTEPSGDILAKYTMTPPDAAFQAALSNRFAADIVEATGQERAGLLLPAAWREFKDELTPMEAETMTIKRSLVNGEPDLVCEMKSGNRVNTMPVRYAHYPSRWFLAVFPGGWQTLAQREGFELPAKFRN